MTTGYAGPRSIDAALAARVEHPGWVVLAGGTDLMVGGGPSEAAGVLDLFGVTDLHGVARHRDTVRIGACTTYAELLADRSVAEVLPLLAAAAADVGAVQVRERGTIGGNVMTASPVGDMLPCLLALDAAVVLASTSRTRAVAYEAFLLGYRAVDVAPDELLVAVEVPVPPPGTAQHWRKVGARAAQAISKVSLAATGRVARGRVEHLRLAFGGVADRPVRLHAVEDLAVGEPAGPGLDAAVEDAVRAALRPITDARSTEDYRRDVAARLAARFVAGLA